MALLRVIPGVEVLAPAQMNQALVRFPSASGSDAAHDAHTDAVIAAIQQDAEAYFTGTTWHGRRAMRISVSGVRTTSTDLERAAQAVARALARTP